MQSVVVPWSNQNVAASNTMNKLQVKLPEIRTKMSCIINYAHHQVHLTMINMLVTSVVLVERTVEQFVCGDVELR